MCDFCFGRCLCFELEIILTRTTKNNIENQMNIFQLTIIIYIYIAKQQKIVAATLQQRFYFHKKIKKKK